MESKLITLAQAARNEGLSPQRVRQLAASDPDFPERQRVGRYWLVSETQMATYFANRRPRPGRPKH